MIRKMKKINIPVLIFACLAFQNISAQKFDLKVKGNKIEYLKDELGNRILDFSYCGYESSDKAIPDVPNVIYVPLQEGDASLQIQRAIDYVSSLKPDKQGFRGAVLLEKGTYQLNNSLWVRASGVVLRGADKQGTILLKQGVDRGPVIRIEGQDNRVTNGSYDLKMDYLPVNERVLELTSVDGLKVGDRIDITRPSTKEWIASIGCDIFGGGLSNLGWKPGDTNITWDRTITAINGNDISIDAPLTVALDAKYGGAKITGYTWSGRISQCGIEHLTLISDYNPAYPKDEDHAWTGISVENAENCWVRQVDFKHFSGNAVILQPTTSKITVEDCIATEPVSEIGGFRRIVFYTLGQQNLFQRCYSKEGINDFAAGYCAPGPNAFVQCETNNSLGFSGAISSWACGLLFDVVNIDGHNLTFKNLGQDKQGAGWGTANSMFWQCTASELECFSPAKDAKNRAYGCWGQFSGDGQWAESNNHVQPRSLFYAQLANRLQRDVSAQGRILPKNTDASSSPSAEDAARMMKEAYLPLVTMRMWIDSAQFTPSVSTDKVLSIASVKPMMKVRIAPDPVISIVDGRLLKNGALITGDRFEVPWWNGNLRPSYINKVAKPDITRYVPGREGTGFTDRIDSVVAFMKNRNIEVLDHNYGLWYDRRRDGHERVRERDGDVWAPFYEQPFARSGEGTAWDGLSKYDLNHFDGWYWYRLKQFADKASHQGMLLYHENFFQHNIIEAGAHWVDCPWRSANNINDLGFPEPVNFTGDKRIFRAGMFYDISVPVRREYYRKYIRQCLNNFEGNDNVVQLISAEFTGPLKFVQFWLDVIGEWEKETGKKATVALSTTKDVQDSILADPERAKLVDIIDIRYWHYKDNGKLYAPLGGQNLAPRQHARLTPVGKVTFEDAYRAVSEYRTKYSDKAVTYFAENYPQMAWAVFMAEGSCPGLPPTDENFLEAAAKMKIGVVKNGNYKELVKNGTGIIIYSQSDLKIPVELEAGKYELSFVDARSGKMTRVVKSLRGGKIYDLVTSAKSPGAWWFKKL